MTLSTLSAERELGLSLQGHYANVATRFVAFVIDLVAAAVVFALGSAVVERILAVLLGRVVSLPDSRVAYSVAMVVWWLLYSAYPLAVSGRTFGMAVLGLRAVRADGSDLSAGRAVVRVLVFPVSFALAGLGFVLIILRRDHRALHDLISGAAVVYAWNARVAHLRFLARDGTIRSAPRELTGTG
jgi:uncharacterized RDD family membrane protein YckC